jgi:periplasmic protein TonB
MKLLSNSIYGRSTVTSILVHSALLVAVILMPPSPPVNSAQNVTTVEVVPVPEQQPDVTPPQEKIPLLPNQTSIPQDQPQTPQPAAAPAPAANQSSLAPQPTALPGESGPSSVALQSGTGTAMPTFAGIPTGPADSIGIGSGKGTAPEPPRHVSSPVAAKFLSGPKPSYPMAAREAGWEGTVIVRIRINTDGSSTVISAPHSGRADIDEAATAAAAAREYSPSLDADGTPVTTERNVKIKFDLSEAD